MSEQVRSAGARARDWLIAAQDLIKSASTLNPRYAFQILVGLWICEQALIEDQSYPCTSSYTHKVCQCIPENMDEAQDFLYADPALVLFSLGILRFFDVHSDQIELFAAKISELLQGHVDQNEEEASELFLVRFLLRRLRLYPPLPAYTLRALTPSELIHADDATIDMLVKNIAAATQFGQVTRELKTDFMCTLSSLLPIIMLDYFRDYNLETGMQVLRCMRYLHLYENKSRRSGLNFLLAQQQADGRFGFFAYELTQLQSTEQQSSPDLYIYLPLTVSFLWTIAETAHPQFVLAQSF
ncbi:hypothetical protein [Dictyobacter formicarum]|nr:hypothetical protein [Dictyobacter formicarum]